MSTRTNPRHAPGRYDIFIARDGVPEFLLMYDVSPTDAFRFVYLLQKKGWTCVQRPADPDNEPVS